ncbi:MAG: MBL fold metallo-hydrolase [Bacillota bacterium]
MNAVAEIYHLFHSGVAVKLADKLLVFDYYKDDSTAEQRTLNNGVIGKDLLQEVEDVFVFVTHRHHDHFNRVIFDWEEYNQNIKYILSADIKLGAKKNKNNLYQMAKYQELEVADLKIETYGTTDEGLSFYVTVEGLTIFHSGDLNWWHWNKFTPEERKVEEDDFKAEVERFKDKKIDIAFVPVDPRLEEHYYLAGEYFAKTVKPQLLVPIHFSSNYYITEKFASKISDLDVESTILTKRGQKIEYQI